MPTKNAAMGGQKKKLTAEEKEMLKKPVQEKKEKNTGKKVAIVVASALLAATTLTVPAVIYYINHQDFQVEIHAVGEDLTSNQTLKLKKGSTIGDIQAPNRDGYYFAGFYSDQELNNELSLDTKITKGTTVYLKYIIINYKFTNADAFENIEIQNLSGEKLDTTQALHHGDKFAVKLTTKTGYDSTFSITGAELTDEYTESGLPIYRIVADNKTAEDKDITLHYDEQIQTFTVHFFDFDGIEQTSQSVQYNNSITVENPQKESTVAEQFSFAGWLIVDENNEPILLEGEQQHFNFGETPITANLYVRADFTSSPREYTLTIDADDQSHVKVELKQGETYTDITAQTEIHYGDILKISYTLSDNADLVTFTINGDDYSTTGPSEEIILTVEGNLTINFEEIIQTNLTFEMNDTNDGYIVTGFQEGMDSAELIIPDTYMGLPVTEIDSYAFYQNQTITKAILGNNITRIGQAAFDTCDNLLEMNIPKKVNYIGSVAVRSKSLTHIILESANGYLDSRAFWQCENINMITITSRDIYVNINEDNLDLACCGIFLYVRHIRVLKSIVDDESTSNSYLDNYFTKTDDEDPLYYIYSAPEIVEEYLLYIDEGDQQNVKVMRGSETLTDQAQIYAGDELRISYTLSQGMRLKTFTINGEDYSSTPQNEEISIRVDGNMIIKFLEVTTEVLEYQLNSTQDGYIVTGFNKWSDDVVELIIPDEYLSKPVTEIKSSAFCDKDTIISVKIGNNVTTIGKDAFSLSENLRILTIGQNVKNIDSLAFNGCFRLTEVINKSNSLTDIQVGSRDYGDVAYYAERVITDESQTGIFNEVDGIIYYKYDNEVVAIGLSEVEKANLTLQQGTTSIKSCAFYGYSSLVEVTIPETITSIGTDAFRGLYQKLTDVKYLGTLKQWCESITGLRGIMATSPSTTDKYALKHLYIGGRQIKGDLIIPNEITKINEYCFAWVGDIKKLTIEGNLTEIRENAFYECLRLTEIVNKSTNLNIQVGSKDHGYVAYHAVRVVSDESQAGTFEEVDGITYYKYDNEIVAVGFLNGEKSVITLQQGTTSVKDEAFYLCKDIKSITIPESVKAIGRAAFWFDLTYTKTVTVTINSKEIYTEEAISYFSSGRLLHDAVKVRVLKSIVDDENLSNTYLNGKEWKKTTDADDKYYLFTKN